jgi:hypothetical protein
MDPRSGESKILYPTGTQIPVFQILSLLVHVVILCINLCMLLLACDENWHKIIIKKVKLSP